MATGSPNREFTSDELDALAAAELPVQDAPIPPSASTAPAAASGAPEPTGSAGLITGEGAPPTRGPAMGPVAQLEAREYSTEELDLLDQANKPQEFTTDELDLEAVAALEDPNYVPTRDEYFEQKATKERLKAQGKIPGNGELAAKAVGGLFVTAADVFYTLAVDPEGSVTRIPETWDRIKADTLKEPKSEALAKAPATLQTGIGRAALSAMQLGGWAKQALEGQPKYINEATGEFLFADAQDPMTLAGFQERYPNQPIRPTNEEDLKDYEFKNHLQEKGIDAEYQALGQKTAPTELLTRVLTGRNQQEAPIESQAQVLEIATDPTNLIPFSAGAKTLGLSRGMKIVSSKTASGIEKLAGGLVKGNDILAERFARVVTEKTGVSPQNISAAANAMTFGRNVGIGGGIAMGATALGAPPEVSATIAGFYPVYKAGMGVLRKIETGAGASKIILRESADATNGLDQAARAAVLANPAVPSIFKEVLERPSQFVSIESTPARLAANQALSPQMRAFMGKLSNPAIVQAVRGSSALATGAAKGAAANVPFALLAANAGQDEDAAAMLAMGGTFGAMGGGVDRFTGLQQRRQQAALSDVSRMLVDIELNGGDVGKMMSTQTPDNLVRLAAMQGTFRNGLDFVPLSAEDYDANVAAQGGAGTAGMFVQAPIGERAKVFINLDARRGGVEPHEFGHALLASGALDGQQKYAARAWVDKTYGPEGVQARAREYASNIIRGKNASAFPDGNFEISSGTLAAEMENLSQGGLARGDMDGLDWARDEIFAETFAKASNSMDFTAIRRGAPAGGNMLTFAESVLGAQARALSASGVRIDPQTGQALDTPGSLFKENPILATDKALLNQLGTYINNYRQWANDPTHEKPRPNRIAPSGRASDLANNPQVTFYDRGDGVKATTFATQDPATGQAILRDQRDLNQEHAKAKEQIRNIVGSKLIPDSNPVLGPKKTADGRVTVRGRVLPPSFDFLNGFMPHIRAFARQFEALGAAGESMQVRYHAIGSGDTGAFRVNRLGNLEAITREVIPWGWELTKAGNLNATVLDLSQFRNRAMRGIAERNPALAPFDYDMGKIEADLKTYMENHRQELPGSTKIGEEKRDAINAILGIATTKNRERNALSGSFGPGSAIKQFRLDRVDAAVGTGRTGFHFDYDRANRNFMPDKPAPMPDLSRDLPMPPKPEIPGTRVRFGRTGQTYSITNPGLVTLGQAMPEAYHGTPHKVDRFSNENIGAGEGTQVYGWGLYFAENPKVAEDYRNRLVDYSSPGRYSWQGQTWDGSDYKSPERHAVSLAYHQGIPFAKKIAKTGIEDSRLGEPYALEQGGETYYRRMLQVANSIKSKKDIQFSQGNLYTVDLDFDPDHLLDWDKPLRQQSPRVQQALGEIVKQRANITGAQFYRFYSPAYSLAGIAPADLAKQASQHLASLGIPGIRYLDQGSRTTGKGTYNYVVFDESLIKIKAENGQPVSPQDLSQGLPTPKGQAMPDNMASGEQWDAYAENLRDDVESWSPARDTGRIDYEMMDVVDNFVDFARNNPQLSGEELSKQFYRAEKPTATQRKKLNAALENVGQPPKSIATPQGQAMPDAVPNAVPDKGIEMPAGSMTQLFNTAAKSLPKTIPQAKSVPSVRVMIREKVFDKKGQPVLDKKGNQKVKVKPKLRNNTEVKFKPGDFELPLPNFQISKSKFSLGNKDLYGTALDNRNQALASISQIDQATSIIESDPLKFIDPKGYTEIMRDAGVTGDILVPPSGIAMMLNRPKDFIDLLNGGFHGPRTVSGTREAAMAGLDSVVEMRQVIGEKPTEFVTALHHLWGTLSKQLPPLDQEALWMRLVINPEVIQQIQNSIDGKFSLEEPQWAEIVNNARESTQGRYEKLGNNATSNANSFHLMLENHNGKWGQVADLYSSKNAIEMRSRFNGLGHGATGIKNKVQGFIGLTFGIKGTVLDRWRFVDLYMDPVMQATGAPSHQHYFQYTGDAKRIPEDPIGIYGNYGTIENGNPAFSLALYNSIDRAAQAAINASPDLQAYLGNHADPGGLHWVTWNAIKNEAVGHSSLDLTKNFLKKFGRTGTASDWVSFANSSKGYVEGQAANGREIIRLTLNNGVFDYSRQ